MRQSFASVVDSSISSGRKPPGAAGTAPPGTPALAAELQGMDHDKKIKDEVQKCLASKFIRVN